VGALVMTHGDDAGLCLPPRLAPVQVVLIVARDEDGVGTTADALASELRTAGLRVSVDRRVDTSFGRRVVDWELKGVPVRVELGPRDLAAGTVTVARRDDGTKTQVPLDTVVGLMPGLLEEVQAALLAGAADRRRQGTVTVATLDEAIAAARDGFAVLPAAELAGDGETRLNQAGVSVRCLQRADGSLPAPDSAGDGDGDLVAVVARAY